MVILGAVVGACLVLFIYYIKITINQRRKEIYEMKYKIDQLEFKIFTCQREIESFKKKLMGE